MTCTACICGAPNRRLPTAFQTGILDSAFAETIMNRRELELAALAADDRGLKARGYIALDEVFREMGKSVLRIPSRRPAIEPGGD